MRHVVAQILQPEDCRKNPLPADESGLLLDSLLRCRPAKKIKTNESFGARFAYSLFPNGQTGEQMFHMDFTPEETSFDVPVVYRRGSLHHWKRHLRNDLDFPVPELYR